MKPLIIISILLIIIILAGTLTYNYLYSESKIFSKKLSQLEESIDDSAWNKAEEIYDNLMDIWDKSCKKYSLIIDHFEIDNISMTISELEAFIDTKNQSEAKAKISSLKVLIIHMAEKEALTLRNIF